VAFGRSTPIHRCGGSVGLAARIIERRTGFPFIPDSLSSGNRGTCEHRDCIKAYDLAWPGLPSDGEALSAPTVTTKAESKVKRKGAKNSKEEAIKSEALMNLSLRPFFSLCAFAFNSCRYSGAQAWFSARRGPRSRGLSFAAPRLRGLPECCVD